MQVFNDKTNRGILSIPVQKLYPVETSSTENNVDENGKDSSMIVSSKEKPKVPLVFDFPASDLGGGEKVGRTMEKQATALDGEMRQKLL